MKGKKAVVGQDFSRGIRWERAFPEEYFWEGQKQPP